MKHIDLQIVKPILEQYGVEYAGVFGSFARGEARADSDIDMLIRLKKPIGLFSLAELEQRLSQALGHKVDLVTEKAISPYIKKDVMHDLQYLYGSR